MPKINISNLDTVEVLSRLTKFAESKTVKPPYCDPEPLNLSIIRTFARKTLKDILENHLEINSIAGVEVNLSIKTIVDATSDFTEIDTTKFDEKYGEDSARKIINTIRVNGAALFAPELPQQPFQYSLPQALQTNRVNGFSKSSS